MRLCCPICREPFDADAPACPNGHAFARRDGVLRLLDPSFEERLRAFADGWTAIRQAEGKRLLDASAYEGLPFSQLASGDPAWRVEWRLRSYDLAAIDGLLKRRGALRILDVGAWNGWLSHRLTAQGHAVTAIDFFADAHDGLAARQHYRTRWRAIQMDLADLSVLDERFDAVILNRCLAFFTDPVAYVARARDRLAPGGVLIATGLQFFRAPGVKAREVAATQKHYRDRHGFDLFLRPTRGYLDFADRDRLRAGGMALRAYPQLWRANLKSMLRPALPRHLYGVCSAGAGA
jgi:2-polyprenyl-3-methyl-5-hydroxy-6-metoxy-1,4-benzoquinol methylase